MASAWRSKSGRRAPRSPAERLAPPRVGAEAGEGLAFLGCGIDAALNTAPATSPPAGHGSVPAPAGPDGATGADREIGRHGAPVRTFVIAAREDIEIAGQVRAVLAGTGTG